MPDDFKYCSIARIDNEQCATPDGPVPSPSQLAEAAHEASQLADAAFTQGDAATAAYVERLLYVFHVRNHFAPPARSLDAVIWSTLMTAKLRRCFSLIHLDENASAVEHAARLHHALAAVETDDHPLVSALAEAPDLSGLATYTKNWYCSTHGFTTQLLSLTQRCNGNAALQPVFTACIENIHDEFFGTPHPLLRARWPERLGMRYSVDAALGDTDYCTEAFSLQNFRTGVACLSDPMYALGSFYSIESVFAGVCRRMYPALRDRGFAEEDIETFRIHEGADDEHSQAFMSALQACRLSARDWTRFFTGAMVQLKLRSTVFEALRNKTLPAQKTNVSRRDSFDKAAPTAAKRSRKAALVRVPPDERRLRDMTLGMAAHPAVLIAHEIGLFRQLAIGSKTKKELEDVLGISPRPMEALLYVSSGIGAVATEKDGYALTEFGRTYFSPKSEFYAGDYFDLLIANHAIYSIDSVRNAVMGDAPQLYGGNDVFKTNAEQALKAQTYTRGMHGISMAPASVWPTRVDLSAHRHLLDIGGGSGAHSIGAVRVWPHLTAQVFDLAPVCEVTDEMVKAAGIHNRITTHCGDMWKDAFPADADVHLYSQIFHDWPRDKCVELADRSYRTLPSGGRIVVHEILFDDDKSGPFAAAGANVVMLLWYPGGKQYSGLEIADILREAGFSDIQWRRTFGYWGVVTAVKH